MLQLQTEAAGPEVRARLPPLSVPNHFAMTITRSMKAFGLGLTCSVLASVSSAQQVVLDFEDLTGFAPISAGYGGVMDWGSWAASDLPDPNYGVNGLVRATSVGLQQPIYFGQEVVFEGANVVTGLDFSFELYLNNALVHTSAVQPPNLGGPPAWLASGYDGPVDELRYVSAVNVFGVDEFTYNIPTAVTALCFGDGSGTGCPCGNVGGADEGCANSTGAGASLAQEGSLSVSADDLKFNAAGLVPSQPALLFAGDNSINAGSGVLFGDGLRCAGGSVLRLGVSTPDAGGNASWGPGVISGAGWAAGDTRYLQAWYRDPVGSPCGGGFNLSHSVEAIFVP